MSYRIYVNDYQCLGNNECPGVLIEELKRQGAEIDDDYCFDEFEIKELQPIIEALEQYIRDVNEFHLNNEYKPRSIADFSDILQEKKEKYRKWIDMETSRNIGMGLFICDRKFFKSNKRRL